MTPMITVHVSLLVKTLVADETEDVSLVLSNTVTCALTTTVNHVAIIRQTAVAAVSVQQLVARMDLVNVEMIYGENSTPVPILRSHVVHLVAALVPKK